MYKTLHTISKDDFAKLLKSKRNLYAYTIIGSDFGFYTQQNKKAWIERIKTIDVERWEIQLDSNGIWIG